MKLLQIFFYYYLYECLSFFIVFFLFKLRRENVSLNILKQNIKNNIKIRWKDLYLFENNLSTSCTLKPYYCGGIFHSQIIIAHYFLGFLYFVTIWKNKAIYWLESNKKMSSFTDLILQKIGLYQFFS